MERKDWMEEVEGDLFIALKVTCNCDLAGDSSCDNSLEVGLGLSSMGVIRGVKTDSRCCGSRLSEMRCVVSVVLLVERTESRLE